MPNETQSTLNTLEDLIAQVQPTLAWAFDQGLQFLSGIPGAIAKGVYEFFYGPGFEEEFNKIFMRKYTSMTPLYVTFAPAEAHALKQICLYESMQEILRNNGGRFSDLDSNTVGSARLKLHGIAQEKGLDLGVPLSLKPFDSYPLSRYREGLSRVAPQHSETSFTYSDIEHCFSIDKMPEAYLNHVLTLSNIYRRHTKNEPVNLKWYIQNILNGDPKHIHRVFDKIKQELNPEENKEIGDALRYLERYNKPRIRVPEPTSGPGAAPAPAFFAGFQNFLDDCGRCFNIGGTSSSPTPVEHETRVHKEQRRPN